MAKPERHGRKQHSTLSGALSGGALSEMVCFLVVLYWMGCGTTGLITSRSVSIS
jgi:hypothetical protein